MALLPKPARPELWLSLAHVRASDGRRHFQVAADAGIHPTELSKILNAHRAPTVKEADRIAVALNRNVAELFPELATEPT